MWDRPRYKWPVIKAHIAPGIDTLRGTLEYNFDDDAIIIILTIILFEKNLELIKLQATDSCTILKFGFSRPHVNNSFSVNK